MDSLKYGRTYHFPFSPGTTSDDRISENYWQHVSQWEECVFTEKMDGGNTCLKKLGVFARSHAAPAIDREFDYLKIKHSMIQHELGNLEVFGENMYGIHSIKYKNLLEHFYQFGVRDEDEWASWDEVVFYAGLLEFPTVPVLARFKPTTKEDFETRIFELIKKESTFGSVENTKEFHTVMTQEQRAALPICTMEGLVARNSARFAVGEESFSKNVLKYVRKGHVKKNVNGEDKHWRRIARRATLVSERKPGLDFTYDQDKLIDG